MVEFVRFWRQILREFLLFLPELVLACVLGDALVLEASGRKTLGPILRKRADPRVPVA